MRAVLLGVLIDLAMVAVATAAPVPDRKHLLDACGAGCGRVTITALHECRFDGVRGRGACALTVSARPAKPRSAVLGDHDCGRRGVSNTGRAARCWKRFGDSRDRGAQNAR